MHLKAAGDWPPFISRPLENNHEGQTVHLLGHYLEDIKTNMIPHGMHTFGRSPDSKAVVSMAGSIQKWNPELDKNILAKSIAKSGPNEMESMLKGLSGRYVEPGHGNDPMRNPGALPTGKNFFGSNPGKLPSPAAWNLGKKAAQQIIANHISKHG